jgi:hypothetical protein
MTDHAVPAFNRSSSQSTAESWAWSGPSNSFTR